MKTATQRFVMLDRDGVINRRIANGYVTRWREFSFLPGALETLRLLKESEYTVVVVSNQSCVGRGLLSWQELQAITRRMLLEVALAGGAIVNVYYCPHAPGDRCECHKPQPGLLRQAMEEHGAWPAQVHMVSDSESDREAAMRAGCRSLQIRRGAFLEDRPHGDSANTASDLREAVEVILRRNTPTLEETLRRDWPRLHGAWQAVKPFPQLTKRTSA